jgi:hypothetical protein
LKPTNLGSANNERNLKMAQQATRKQVDPKAALKISVKPLGPQQAVIDSLSRAVEANPAIQRYLRGCGDLVRGAFYPRCPRRTAGRPRP